MKILGIGTDCNSADEQTAIAERLTKKFAEKGHVSFFDGIKAGLSLRQSLLLPQVLKLEAGQVRGEVTAAEKTRMDGVGFCPSFVDYFIQRGKKALEISVNYQLAKIEADLRAASAGNQRTSGDNSIRAINELYRADVDTQNFAIDYARTHSWFNRESPPLLNKAAVLLLHSNRLPVDMVPSLLRLLPDSDEAVHAIIIALFRFDSSPSPTPISNKLAKQDPVATEVYNSLKSTDVFIKRGALQVIAKWSPSYDQNALIPTLPLLTDADQKVRNEAWKLIRLYQAPFIETLEDADREDKQIIDTILTHLKTGNAEIQMQALDTMGQWDLWIDEVSKPVHDKLKSNDPEVKKHAQSAVNRHTTSPNEEEPPPPDDDTGNTPIDGDDESEPNPEPNNE